MNQLKKGDHVVTIGRLHGVIDEINQEAKTVTLDCDGIYLVFDMNAIATVSQRAAASEVASATTEETTTQEDETATTDDATSADDSADEASEEPKADK